MSDHASHTEPYIDRLHDAVTRMGNPIVVGLDPHLGPMPEPFGAIARDPNAPRTARAEAMADFLIEVIDVAAGRVPAVKPQSAFFEAFGADGVRAYERVVAAARDASLLVVADVKRGDIGSTAAAYAQAFLTGAPGLADDPSLADAATVNPYLGEASLRPFVDACKAAQGGLYVLVRTSNPSSADFQNLRVDGSDERLCERVAAQVNELGQDVLGSHGWSSVGAVVGATHPAELVRMRELMPNTPFLLPGYGAQGASADDIVGGFAKDSLHGALVNSSRGILFAYAKEPGHDWKTATSMAIETMAADLRAALGQ